MGTTPIYGFPYPDPSDLVANYPALGQQLAEDVETEIAGLGSGLNIMVPTSIANSGGSASASGAAVTFTGVTSISLNGVFTSTYPHYLVLLAYESPDVNLLMRLRAAGTDATGANYNTREIVAGGSLSSSASRGATSFGMGYTGSVGTYQQITIYRPQLATATGVIASLLLDRASSTETIMNSGNHTLTNAYDGFTYFVGSGNITGTVRVYGYQNS